MKKDIDEVREAAKAIDETCNLLLLVGLPKGALVVALMQQFHRIVAEKTGKGKAKELIAEMFARAPDW